MPTEAEIRENLLDAGCSETEMRSILKSICGGKRQVLLSTKMFRPILWSAECRQE